MKSVLITGAAGFIGYHASLRLLADGRDVVGIDNLNSYYDPNLKRARLGELAKCRNFRFKQCDLIERKTIAKLFATHRFSHVLHLAAQAGVRYSLIDPYAYADSNLLGFVNILEGCRREECEHLIYASSSSVYGANTRMPLRTSDNTDHPLSLYGATKKANESMAHCYSSLFGLPTTGLRFFTVYGPWGRPDMATWQFAAAIRDGQPIRLFNRGRMRRDFTYVDDVIEALVRLMQRPPRVNPAWSSDPPDPASSNGPWQIYNVGNSEPVELLDIVRLIEGAMGKTTTREFLPMQAGDVPETFADCADLERVVGFRPRTPIEDGIGLFVNWFRQFHKLG